MAYGIMLCTARTQLALGLSVILDSPLSNIRLYHDATAIAPEVRSLCKTVRESGNKFSA